MNGNQDNFIVMAHKNLCTCALSPKTDISAIMH